MSTFFVDPGAITPLRSTSPATCSIIFAIVSACVRETPCP